MSSGDDIRTSAEVVETDDGFEVLPPDVRVMGEVADDLLEAVEAAVSDTPNTVDDPALSSVESKTDFPEKREHHAAYFHAHYQELPATGEDGEVVGWKASYQAREEFEKALDEHLSDRYGFEARDNSTTTFYEVDR